MSVKEIRPIQRTGRFWSSDVVEIRAGPSGPTLVFFSPQTKIAPAKSVPIIDIWYNLNYCVEA
ncbi:hypothetical protein [Rhizobium sp. FKY42]|uniref:hypothetical protein n=1 Tax=Rhizobium sp. FKY42 TaxID=2562310 RepID=UPI0010C0DC0F|nr:hypothetical protein [Rhizobium sp. FKY42]